MALMFRESVIEGLPPSTIFGSLIGPPKDAREPWEALVSMLESASKLDPKLALAASAVAPASLPDVRGLLLVYEHTVALIKQEILISKLRELGLDDLKHRYVAAVERGLAMLVLLHDFLKAAVENAEGLLRGESLDERLRRSVAQAETSTPIDLGSFAQYAEE